MELTGSKREADTELGEVLDLRFLYCKTGASGRLVWEQT